MRLQHGPASVSSAIGCGVDYAHLHLVPTKCDVRSGAERLAPFIGWRRVGSIRDVRHHAKAAGGYWFVQQPYAAGLAYVGCCLAAEAPSQLFRKVIASYVGDISSYDWKDGVGDSLILRR